MYSLLPGSVNEGRHTRAHVSTDPPLTQEHLDLLRFGRSDELGTDPVGGQDACPFQ